MLAELQLILKVLTWFITSSDDSVSPLRDYVHNENLIRIQTDNDKFRDQILYLTGTLDLPTNLKLLHVNCKLRTIAMQVRL